MTGEVNSQKEFLVKTSVVRQSQEESVPQMRTQPHRSAYKAIIEANFIEIRNVYAAASLLHQQALLSQQRDCPVDGPAVELELFAKIQLGRKPLARCIIQVNLAFERVDESLIFIIAF